MGVVVVVVVDWHVRHWDVNCYPRLTYCVQLCLTMYTTLWHHPAASVGWMSVLSLSDGWCKHLIVSELNNAYFSREISLNCFWVAKSYIAVCFNYFLSMASCCQAGNIDRLPEQRRVNAGNATLSECVFDACCSRLPSWLTVKQSECRSCLLWISTMERWLYLNSSERRHWVTLSFAEIEVSNFSLRPKTN